MPSWQPNLPADCQCSPNLASRELYTPAKFLEIDMQTVAKQTAIYCSSKITLKKVKKVVPSVRKPVMK